MRKPEYIFTVAGFGHRSQFIAKTVGGAVSMFRRKWNLTLHTDRDTGGWKGISTDCKKRI
jgi:hypothetical protein